MKKVKTQMGSGELFQQCKREITPVLHKYTHLRQPNKDITTQFVTLINTDTKIVNKNHEKI